MLNASNLVKIIFYMYIVNALHAICNRLQFSPVPNLLREKGIEPL